ncbi:MAG: response regulator [Chitinophagaceae bacterium]|nr:response regulator [Oligoflexus sp.]
MINLVNNAIKFTTRGHVAIEVQFEKILNGKTYLRFEVSDTGIGIPKEALHRLFHTFSQADSTTTRRFGGTGLGLSISKHLVQLMGGEIGVRSEEGVGSTFWFVVPLGIGKDLEFEGPLLIPVPKHHRRLRVLIAEDNATNQIIAIKMVEKMGHTAVAVGNGQEAVDALRSAHYDLLFMDCHMPELDGYEATQCIRSNSYHGYSKIPIIAMTANALQGDRDRCISAGMNNYISKPIKFQDLSNIIDETLTLHAQSA